MSDLDDLDRTLQAVRFTPRASLGAEIRGRAARGEQPPVSRWHRPRRSALLAAGLGGVLITAAVGHELTRVPRAQTVDQCCQDLDGGGQADDGLLVTSVKGETVRRLAIYEDRDASRSFSPGDSIRFQRQSAPVFLGPIQGVLTREFCCLDYDGGGPDDDALVVMGHPPDRITMAAIVERGGPPGAPAPLR